MHENRQIDYYEMLQISPNADVELIQRVFRLLRAAEMPWSSVSCTRRTLS